MPFEETSRRWWPSEGVTVGAPVVARERSTVAGWDVSTAIPLGGPGALAVVTNDPGETPLGGASCQGVVAEPGDPAASFLIDCPKIGYTETFRATSRPVLAAFGVARQVI